MKNGDFYNHYKNVEYYFDCIALPLNDRNKAKLEYIGTTRYHEDTHDIDLYFHKESGVTFIDADVPHVIYQSEKHYDTNFTYAREVDDFFGYKIEHGNYIKRFTLK